MAADRASLEHLAIQDHPYHPGHFDALTLATVLATRTRHLAAFTDVADLRLRPPLMLAKTAASLAVARGGRFNPGVGGASPAAVPLACDAEDLAAGLAAGRTTG
jgi:alkanesulfonate monooxygenase SsuD/methylene tetrahydromethanopterin reductase-like flavin-dependent oxidoreductase (luciferase family)